MRDINEKKKKFEGCILGAAIGDALGAQTEGLTMQEIKQQFGNVTDYGLAPAGRLHEKRRAAQYTDDTEQLIVLASSILECRGFDPLHFAKKFTEWGSGANEDPIRSRFIGPSSRKAIASLKSGTDWPDSGSDTPTCGSAMRVAPTGLFYNENLAAVKEKARLSSIPTHRSRAAIAGAIAAAVAVAAAVNDVKPPEIIEQAAKSAYSVDRELSEKLMLTSRLKNRNPEDALDLIGTSYMVYHTVPAAFYCFARNPGSPREAILTAVNGGGDTDSIAAITGAICGALNGIDALPEKWVTGIEDSGKLIKLADDLFEASRQGVRMVLGY